MNQEKINILLAEDDPNLGNILKKYLEAKGFQVKLCINGQEAIEEFHNGTCQLCIIDVMMPIKDGFTLAKEIRKLDQEIPILFLTAKSMHDDVLKGFQIGADDYITKPFSMEILLARITAISRRSINTNTPEPEETNFTIGLYEFDYTRQILKHAQQEQRLTTREAELLKILCENKNSVLDRGLALHKIWHSDSYFSARSMDVYITKLRKYLKDDPSIQLLNVHGIGFKLITD